MFFVLINLKGKRVGKHRNMSDVPNKCSFYYESFAGFLWCLMFLDYAYLLFIHIVQLQNSINRKNLFAIYLCSFGRMATVEYRAR